MHDMEADAIALFQENNRHGEWDKLDGHSKEIWRAQARTKFLESSPAVPVAEPPAAPVPTAMAVAAEPEEPAEEAEDDKPKKKSKR